MKRNLFYLTVIVLIALIFLNYNIVLTSTIDAVNIWLYKVFPYLFIMIVINDSLISMDFARMFKNTTHYVFIMSLLSGTPTSAYIITNLYKEGKMTKNNANISLIFTYFCNPLFLFSILNLIFNDISVTIKLILIHYISNIILYFIYKKQIDLDRSARENSFFNLSSSIKKSISTVTMVLGTITLYMVLSEVITNVLTLNGFPKVLFKGFLEITQGLNYLISLNIPFKLKEILAIFFISFGGLSIHTQIKCILDETDLSYKYFLKGRIWQLLIAILLTCIT